jgi:hypothetical protein
MSLMRLLSAGKSLVGAEDLEGKYRLPQDRAVPEFGANRGVSSVPGSPNALTLLKNSHTPSPEVGGDESATGTPVGAPSEPQPGRGQLKAKNSLWARIKDLVRRVARMLKREPKSAIPVFQKLPVQGELSLDKVKVLRNNLLDTDLEVVSRRKDAQKSSGSNERVALQVPDESQMTESRMGGPDESCRCSNISRS